MNIAICEDEIKQQALIEDMINNLRLRIDFQVHKFSSGEELIKAYKKGEYFSIILLDIQMEGIDGIKTAEIIRSYDKNCIIIIITSIIEYAIEGYSVNAFDFILKPINEEKFKYVLTNATKKLHDSEKQIYMIVNRGKIIILKLSSIICIESNGRKVNIIYEKEKYISNESITNVENKLTNRGFVRISRYFLVNLAHVIKIVNRDILLSNGDSMPISAKLFENIKNQYINYMMEGEIRDRC